MITKVHLIVLLTILVCSKSLASPSCKSFLESEKISSLTYSLNWNGEVRTFKLPSIVQSLKNEENVKAIIFAGNTFYDGTRHNLGFHLADHIIDTRLESEEVFAEQADALFDDGKIKSGVIDFKTAPEVYRTKNGEIAPIILENGQMIVLIKPIGDYNEIGDFAVPALNAMGIKSKDAILVSDDLDTQLGDVVTNFGLIAPNGNNSVVSINRNLAIQSLRVALESPSNLFSSADARTALNSLKLKLSEKLNIRSGNKKIADAETLKIQVLKGLQAIFNSVVLPAEIQSIKGPLAAVLKKKGALLKEAHSNKKLSSEEKQNLLDKVAEIELVLEPSKKAETDKTEELKAALNQFLIETETLLNENMSYTRVSLGTGRPNETTSLADFVLGAYPADIFDKSYMQKAEKVIFNLMSGNPE